MRFLIKNESFNNKEQQIIIEKKRINHRYEWYKGSSYKSSCENMRYRWMDGYMVLERTWKEDEISLEFPMAPRKVVADSRIAEDLGKGALEYGPLVYAFEQVDQKEDLNRLRITPWESFSPKMENELLGGIVTLSSENAKAVPYYSWSNRGIGKMKVWIPLVKE